MKTLKLSYEKIYSFKPCYDPIRHISKNWTGSAISLLKMKHIPAKDRLWVIVRQQLMTITQLKTYGLACAKLVEKFSADTRVKECNKTTARFLLGKATVKELSIARNAARAARAARAAAYAAYAANAQEKQVKLLIKILSKGDKS